MQTVTTTAITTATTIVTLITALLPVSLPGGGKTGAEEEDSSVVLAWVVLDRSRGATLTMLAITQTPLPR